MYQKLKTPLKSGALTKKNICIPCFHSLDGKPKYAHVWKKFVNSSALDNMKKHIKKMHTGLIPYKNSIQQESAKK